MKTKKYLRMWMYSLIFFSLGLISFIVFTYKQGHLLLWLFCIACFSVFAALFSKSNRALLCEDGYTVVQAMYFYSKCKKRFGKSPTQKELRSIAKKYSFSEKLDERQLKVLLKTGRDVMDS